MTDISGLSKYNYGGLDWLEEEIFARDQCSPGYFSAHNGVFYTMSRVDRHGYYENIDESYEELEKLDMDNFHLFVANSPRGMAGEIHDHMIELAGENPETFRYNKNLVPGEQNINLANLKLIELNDWESSITFVSKLILSDSVHVLTITDDISKMKELFR